MKMFQQRKQGIQTDHMGKGKQGIEKKIEIMMKTATILTFIVEIISIYFNTTMFPRSIRIVGILLGMMGNIIFIISVLTMKESWRAGVSYEEKTDLIIKCCRKAPSFSCGDLRQLFYAFINNIYH